MRVERRIEIDQVNALAQKRMRDQLPKRITETLKRGEELIKAAKGLDD